MALQCNICGGNMPDDSRFCENCGSLLIPDSLVEDLDSSSKSSIADSGSENDLLWGHLRSVIEDYRGQAEASILDLAARAEALNQGDLGRQMRQALDQFLQEEYRIITLGLSASGKSTLLHALFGERSENLNSNSRDFQELELFASNGPGVKIVSAPPLSYPLVVDGEISFAVQQCDAVIFVIPASRMLSREEWEMLKQIQATGRRVYKIINMHYCELSLEFKEYVWQDFCSESKREVFPHDFDFSQHNIFFIDCVQAARAVQERNSLAIEDTGLSLFAHCLSDFLLGERYSYHVASRLKQAADCAVELGNLIQRQIKFTITSRRSFLSSRESQQASIIEIWERLLSQQLESIQTELNQLMPWASLDYNRSQILDLLGKVK